MVSGRGRHRRHRGHDFGERGSLGGGRDSYGGRQNGFDKGPHQCRHCEGNNHISEKCWEKFGHPEWVELVDSDSATTDDTTHAPSATSSGSSDSPTVVL